MHDSWFRVAALAGVIFASSSAHGVTIDIFPAFQEATVHTSPFDVEVRVSDLPDGNYITYFDLLLGYDASRVRPKSVEFSDVLGDIDPDFGPAFPASTLDYDPTNIPGYGGYSGQHDTAVRFNNVWFGSDPGPLETRQSQSAQPFTLATITFDVIYVGWWTNTLLQLMDNSSFQSFPQQGGSFDVKDENGGVIPGITLQSGVARVPLSGTLPLLLAPLLAMFASRMRRQTVLA